MAIPKKVTMDNLFFRECIVKRNAMVSNGEYRADLEKDIKKSGYVINNAARNGAYRIAAN